MADQMFMFATTAGFMIGLGIILGIARVTNLLTPPHPPHHPEQVKKRRELRDIILKVNLFTNSISTEIISHSRVV